jgi:mannose-1-phosphate guanylyltransferase
MYVVILAGGGGTRLYPLSTPDRPKPFLPLLDERSLFRRTIDRLVDGPELDVEPGDITVVAARPLGAIARSQAPSEVAVIEEPVGRNTAAAIALATLAVERDDEDVMVVLPADHRIDPAREGRFRSVLRTAAERLATGAFDVDAPLVTLGVQVDRPATEFGYLLPDVGRGATVGTLEAYPLRAFEEKPDAARARALVATEGVAWNAGMFLWRRRTIRAALERYTALMTLLEPSIGSTTGLAAAYDRIRPVSIDAAVMEGAARNGTVAMASMDVGWSDLGSWTALLAALGGRADGRVVQAGHSAEAGPEDLIVRRIEGRLVVEDGPRAGILDAHGPSALLIGARGDRAIVEGLVARCSEPETRP